MVDSLVEVAEDWTDRKEDEVEVGVDRWVEMI